MCHIICNEKEYSHILAQKVADEISKKFESFEKQLEEIKNKEVDND